MTADLEPQGGDLTVLLQAYARGNQQALRSLIEQVYAELRIIAAGQLRGESHNSLMGPTALVNEAYLRLVSGAGPTEWANRRHFFAAASEAMRRILIDQARKRLSLKRGGVVIQTSLEEATVSTDIPDEELLDIDWALSEFAEIEPDKAELVKLRFFMGLSENETADMLGVSRATASRHWTYARAWLFNRLKSYPPQMASEQKTEKL